MLLRLLRPICALTGLLLVVPSSACKKREVSSAKSVVALQAGLDAEVRAGGQSPTFVALADWFNAFRIENSPTPVAKDAAQPYRVVIKEANIKNKIEPGLLQDMLGVIAQEEERLGKFDAALANNDEAALKALLKLEVQDMIDIAEALLYKYGHRAGELKTANKFAILLSLRTGNDYIDRYAEKFLYDAFVDRGGMKVVAESLAIEADAYLRTLVKVYVENPGTARDRLRQNLRDNRKNLLALRAGLAAGSGSSLAGPAPAQVDQVYQVVGQIASLLGLGSIASNSTDYKPKRPPQAANRDASVPGTAGTGAPSVFVPMEPETPKATAGEPSAPSEKKPLESYRESSTGAPPDFSSIEGQGKGAANAGGKISGGDLGFDPGIDGWGLTESGNDCPAYAPIARDCGGKPTCLPGRSSLCPPGGERQFDLAPTGTADVERSGFALDAGAANVRIGENKTLCESVKKNVRAFINCMRHSPLMNTTGGTVHVEENPVPTATPPSAGLGLADEANELLLPKKLHSIMQDQNQEGACTGFGFTHALICSVKKKLPDFEYDAWKFWGRYEKPMMPSAEAAALKETFVSEDDKYEIKVTKIEALRTIEEMENALKEKDCLWTASGVNASWHGASGAKGAEILKCGSDPGAGHAYSVQGFQRVDENGNGGGYFLVKNSWGEGWGVQGYARLPYQCVKNADGGMPFEAHRIRWQCVRGCDGGATPPAGPPAQ